MKGLTVRMKANDVAEILLYDQVGRDPFFGDGVSAKEFREQVKGVKAKTLNLRINSPGGSVFEAAAMLAALDDFRRAGRVEVDVDGLAASAASVVAMGGDVVRISADGMVMVHNPYGGVLGGADDMRTMADSLDKIRGQMLDRYEAKARGKSDRAALGAMLDAETWLTGREAVDAGLADEVTGALHVAASADLSKFKYRHPPASALAPSAADWEAHRKRAEVAARLCRPGRPG